MTDEKSVTPPPEPVPEQAAADVAIKKRDPRSLRIAIAAGVVVLALGLWLVTLIPGWLSRDPGAPVATPSPESATARRIQATLFYVSASGGELEPVTREVVYGATPAEQAKQILIAQLQAPADGAVSAIPAGTTVRGVFVGARGELYVDLSPEATTANPGGSMSEALAVFAIVNAITANLHDVTAVQILIDGKEVDTLAGHVDLREPIARSDAWVRKGQ